MTGFFLPENYIENPEKLVRRPRPRVVPPPATLQVQKPSSEAPTVREAMARKTLRELSIPSTTNVATGPNDNVGDINFELKSSVINMVQASPFCGKPNEDANAHLQNFLELCDTIVIRCVTADVVKLRMFPFSLSGKAKQGERHRHLGQMLEGIPRKVLSTGQDECPAREDIKFPADRDGIHLGSLGKAARIHHSLSSSWDGRMARPPKLLQSANNDIPSPYRRYC